MLTASTTIWISSGYNYLLFPIHEVKRTFHSLVSLVSDICITKPTAAAIMVRKKRCINYLLENHFNTYTSSSLLPRYFPLPPAPFPPPPPLRPVAFTLAAACTVPAAAFEANHIKLIGSTTCLVTRGKGSRCFCWTKTLDSFFSFFFAYFLALGVWLLGSGLGSWQSLSDVANRKIFSQILEGGGSDL